jgi:hypothetical protein
VRNLREIRARSVRACAVLPQCCAHLAGGEKWEIVVNARVGAIEIECVGVDAGYRFLRSMKFFGDAVNDLRGVDLRHDDSSGQQLGGQTSLEFKDIAAQDAN